MIQGLSQQQSSDRVRKVVDETLKQLLGEEATQIIYDHLEIRYLIKRDQIPEKLDSFNQALEDYLGKGAMIIEKVISENLLIGGF